MRNHLCKIVAAFLMLFNGTTMACRYPAGARTASDSVATQMDSKIPAGWKRVDAEGKFTFYLPPDLKDTGASGTDSLYRDYSNGRMHLTFEYQPMSALSYDKREQEFGKNFQETTMTVGGHEATLFVYTRAAGGRKEAHVELYVGDLRKGEVLLHMWAIGNAEADVERAKTIFSTIQFTP